MMHLCSNITFKKYLKFYDQLIFQWMMHILITNKNATHSLLGNTWIVDHFLTNLGVNPSASAGHVYGYDNGKDDEVHGDLIGYWSPTGVRISLVVG